MPRNLHLILLASLLPLFAACNKEAPSTSNPQAAASLRNRGFIRAQIKRHFDANENPVPTTAKTIDDATQIQKLIAFFPGCDTGRTSPITGNWKSHADVRVYRADGSSLLIKSDYKVWSEGNGDFPLRGPFRQYIATLFE